MNEPLRFCVLSFNLWNTEAWDLREKTLASFLAIHDPDICYFQEVRSRNFAALDGMLLEHGRVRDEFVGWSEAGSIYYKRELFEEIEHGDVDLDIPERDRRLLWVRLKVAECGGTVLACTFHLTHQGNADEIAPCVSYRHRETHAIVDALEGLARPGEAVLV